jgi:hypothetical protein
VTSLLYIPVFCYGWLTEILRKQCCSYLSIWDNNKHFAHNLLIFLIEKIWLNIWIFQTLGLSILKISPQVNPGFLLNEMIANYSFNRFWRYRHKCRTEKVQVTHVEKALKITHNKGIWFILSRKMYILYIPRSRLYYCKSKYIAFSLH